MAEQHRVGDRAEERRAHDGAHDRDGHMSVDPTPPATTRPMSPITGATQIERRRELRALDDRDVARSRLRSIPVIAAHARRTLVVLGSLVRCAHRLAGHRDRQRDQPSPPPWPATRSSRPDTVVPATPAANAPMPSATAMPRDQPPVTEPDLAVAGRDPQEGEDARGPLQEHGRRVETDHVAEVRVADRAPPGSRSRRRAFRADGLCHRPTAHARCQRARGRWCRHAGR